MATESSTLVHPDVIYVFPENPGPSFGAKDRYWKHRAVTRWCWDHGLLPKASDGTVQVLKEGRFGGLRAEIWSGTTNDSIKPGEDHSRHYVALKFAGVEVTEDLLNAFLSKCPDFKKYEQDR